MDREVRESGRIHFLLASSKTLHRTAGKNRCSFFCSIMQSYCFISFGVPLLDLAISDLEIGFLVKNYFYSQLGTFRIPMIDEHIPWELSSLLESTCCNSFA